MYGTIFYEYLPNFFCFIFYSIQSYFKMPKPNTDCASLSPNAIQVSERKDFKDEVKIQKMDQMVEFTRSMTVDARAAVALGQCLDMKAAKKFIEIIERCDGTLITSGIGKICSHHICHQFYCEGKFSVFLSLS